MAGAFTMVYEDYDGDTQQVSLELASPANDGSDLSAWQTGLLALRDAWEALCAGRLRRNESTAFITDNGKGSATSPLAQKVLQAVHTYRNDSTGIEYTVRLPMPDLSVQDGGDNVWIKQGDLTVLDLTSTQGAAWKAQFDGKVKHEGDAVTLEKVHIKE